MSGLYTKKFCRVCRWKGYHNNSVFAKSRFDDETIKINVVIMKCASVQVHKNDGLPNHICAQCLERLEEAYKFRRLCEKSDVELRRRQQPDKPVDLVSSDDEERVEVKKEVLDVKQEIDEGELGSGASDYAEDRLNWSDESMEDIKFDVEEFRRGFCSSNSSSKVEDSTNAAEKGNVDNKRSESECSKKSDAGTQLSSDKTLQSCERKFVLQQQQDIGGSVICKECGITCKSVSEMLRHAKEHTHPFKCNLCNAIFEKASSLNLHHRKHVSPMGEVLIAPKGVEKRGTSQAASFIEKASSLNLHHRKHVSPKGEVLIAPKEVEKRGTSQAASFIKMTPNGNKLVPVGELSSVKKNRQTESKKSSKKVKGELKSKVPLQPDISTSNIVQMPFVPTSSPMSNIVEMPFAQMPGPINVFNVAQNIQAPVPSGVYSMGTSDGSFTVQPQFVGAVPQFSAVGQYIEPTITQLQLQPQLQGQNQPQLHGQLQGTIQPQLQGTIQPQLHGQLQGTIQPQLQGTIQPQQQGTIQPQLQGTIQQQLQGTIQPQLQGTIQPQLQGTIQPQLQGTIQPQLQTQQMFQTPTGWFFTYK